MTSLDTELKWPWIEFPEDASTWQECLKQVSELRAELAAKDAEIAKLNTRVWGTISGGNLSVRGYHDKDNVGSGGEPWVVEEESGTHWSCFDVTFTPDADRIEELQKFTSHLYEKLNQKLEDSDLVKGLRGQLVERAATIKVAAAELTAAKAEIERLRAARRIHELDNHHNAILCPYCNGPIKDELARLKATDAERHEFKHEFKQHGRDEVDGIKRGREMLAAELLGQIDHCGGTTAAFHLVKSLCRIEIGETPDDCQALSKETNRHG